MHPVAQSIPIAVL